MVVNGHTLRCEKKKKPGQDSQSLFIKPRTDRKSISVACNYSHADSVKKSSFFYLSSRPWKSWGGPYPDSKVHGAIQLFLTEAHQHSDTFTLLRSHVYTEPTYAISTLSQGRNKYKQFLDNDAHTHTIWSRMHIKLNSIIIKGLKILCISLAYKTHPIILILTNYIMVNCLSKAI